MTYRRNNVFTYFIPWWVRCESLVSSEQLELLPSFTLETLEIMIFRIVKSKLSFKNELSLFDVWSSADWFHRIRSFGAPERLLGCKPRFYNTSTPASANLRGCRSKHKWYRGSGIEWKNLGKVRNARIWKNGVARGYQMVEELGIQVVTCW